MVVATRRTCACCSAVSFCSSSASARSVSATAICSNGVAQLGELPADGAGRELAAQAREPLVDGGAHGRETHELRKAAILRGLDHFVHADARKAGSLRGCRIDVRRQAEVDDQRRLRRAWQRAVRSELAASTGSLPPVATTRPATSRGCARNASSGMAVPLMVRANSSAVSACDSRR